VRRAGGENIVEDLGDLAVEREIEVLLRGGGVAGLDRRLGEAKEARVDTAVEKGEDVHGERTVNLKEAAAMLDAVPVAQWAKKRTHAAALEIGEHGGSGSEGLPDCIHRVKS
jgi:hypothetical protein